MQPNQQMNTYFIQASQPLTPMQPNANIINSNIFQQIRMPGQGNIQWAVSPMSNTITLNQPIQVNQNNQRLESKPHENFIINNRPSVIIGNPINFNQRYASPNQIVNQNQISQIQKFSTVQPQISIPQQQQQQNRQINTPLQRTVSASVSDNVPIEIKDNNVPVIASASSIQAISKPIMKAKEEIVESQEDPVTSSKDSVNSNRIAQMVRQIDEHLQLDEDMKGVFSQYLEDFLQNVTENALRLARLRNSDTLEMKDFQYIMEKDWGIYLPGYPSINEKPKQSAELEIHKTRMNIIKKSNK